MGYFERISDDHIVDYYDSGNTGERPPLTMHSLLQSDGMNPIKITFKNTNDKDSLWLNGFVLRRIK
jgi:beta-galactosidase